MIITPLHKQIFVSSAIILIAICFGAVLGYISVLIQLFQDENSSIKLDMDTASWIAAIPGLAGTASILMPPIMQLKGRKLAFMLGCSLITVGCIIIYFATKALSIIIATVFWGIGIKSVYIVSNLTIGEMVDPKYRNIFFLANNTAVSVGVALVHLFGNFLHWKTINVIINVIAVISFLMACYWPESPAWLAYRRKFDECEKAFFWLRGYNKETFEELTAMVNFQKVNLEKSSNVEISEGNSVTNLWKKITGRDFYLPVSLTFVMVVSYYWSGSMALIIYAMDLITKMTQNESAAFIGMIALDSVVILGNISSAFLLKRFNNKPLWLWTSFISALFMFGASIVTYLQSINYVDKDSFLCIYFLVGFMLASSVGPYNLSFSIASELMPVKHKGLGGALYILTICLCYGSAMKLSPYMVVSFNLHGTFLVFIGVILTSILIVWKYLPETKNKTLKEIEDFYNKNNINEEYSKCSTFEVAIGSSLQPRNRRND